MTDKYKLVQEAAWTSVSQRDLCDCVEFKVQCTAQLSSTMPAHNCKVYLTPEQGEELLQYMNEHPGEFDDRGCFIGDEDEWEHLEQLELREMDQDDE